MKILYNQIYNYLVQGRTTVDKQIYQQDLTIPFTQLNKVYKEIKNKVLLPFVKFPCHKVAYHKNSTSSFAIMAILLKAFQIQQKKKPC